MTLSIQKGTSYTIGATVTGSVSFKESAIFAAATESFSVAVTGSRTTSTTFGGSWTVPKKQKTGWLEVGTTSAYKFKWKKWHMVGECTVKTDGKGKAVAPSKSSALMYKHS